MSTVNEGMIQSGQDSVSKSGKQATRFYENPLFVYIIRRIFVLIPLWFGISIVTFAMIRLSGDPRDLVIGVGESRQFIVETITKQYSLDKSYPEQYFAWLGNFLTWEFGYSGTFSTYDPSDRVMGLLIATARLQYAALILSILIAIPLGIFAAKNRGTTTDYTVSTLALLGLSMPIFLTGFILIAVFGDGGLGWFPSKGASSTNLENLANQKYDNWVDQEWFKIKDIAHHLVLPLIALTFFQIALITRLIRSSMLEVLEQDYILAARANGISERKITWKHSLRNAIIPAITFIAISIGTALAGAPITETVFQYPGLGRYFVIAIGAFDTAIVLGITMIITTLILFSNLMADILYILVDPRIRV